MLVDGCATELCCSHGHDCDNHCSHQWQPIETAPKDGTPVLLYENNGEGCTVAFWDADDEHWIAAGIRINYATHWMPLPPLPVEGETDGDL